VSNKRATTNTEARDGLSEAIETLRNALMPFVAAWTNGPWDSVPHKHLRHEMFMDAQKALLRTYGIAREPAQPQWHKFDKDDLPTWPEKGRYWVALRNGDVSYDVFQAERTSQYRIWSAFDPKYVTHWMPIEVPAPPTTEEEVVR
jgi:hypothetical protein